MRDPRGFRNWRHYPNRRVGGKAKLIPSPPGPLSHKGRGGA
jgi:hypothetical protein